MFHVQHLYSILKRNDVSNYSLNTFLKPGEEKEVFDKVYYETGFLAGLFSGKNRWWISGTKLIQTEGMMIHIRVVAV